MPVAACAVIKSAAEDRYTLGLAYPADRLDAHGEFMPAREVELTAWDYVAKHRIVGLYHVDGLVGHGEVVESYIYRGPDWDVPLPDGSTYVVKSGDWMLGTRWDAAAWSLIQSGKVDGLSMQGKAIRVPAPDAVLRD